MVFVASRPGGGGRRGPPRAAKLGKLRPYGSHIWRSGHTCYYELILLSYNWQKRLGQTTMGNNGFLYKVQWEHHD